MAALRTQNGRILTRNGAAACACCDEAGEGEVISFGFNLGTVGNCNCDGLICFDPDDFLTPDADEFVFDSTNPPTYQSPNPYYPYANPGPEAFVQIPWSFTNTPGPGWKNIVSEPSLMRISGTVGGDIRIVVNKFVVNSDPTFPVIDEIIDEGEAPCGTCFTPRNGIHSISYTFPLKPQVILAFDLRTYTICTPYFRGTISRLGPLAP